MNDIFPVENIMHNTTAIKTYIGIDNGVTGSIAVLNEAWHSFQSTPVYSSQNYTKVKKNITRLHFYEFLTIINLAKSQFKNVTAILERPLVNPGMFQATVSAVRCLEAQLIVLETTGIPFMYIDSKEWQKAMLPQGVKGRDELKKASMDIGIRLFPLCADVIRKQEDADGLLIAEYARRKRL